MPYRDIESAQTLENPFPRVLLQNNHQKSSKIFRQKKRLIIHSFDKCIEGFERNLNILFFAGKILNRVVNFL